MHEAPLRLSSKAATIVHGVLCHEHGCSSNPGPHFPCATRSVPIPGDLLKQRGEAWHDRESLPVLWDRVRRVAPALVLHKIWNQAGVGPLKRDGQDAANLFECSWLAML